jgi:porphobilinogen synthase
MIKAAAEKGYLDEKSAFIETSVAFKRAGSSAVISYAALEISKWLQE